METSYLINTFILVVDCGSMSEAARRLDLAPAAVAQQLRVLDREMGAPLLTRSGRTVAPTDAGHHLIERARALVRDVGNLKAAISEDAATQELRLGAVVRVERVPRCACIRPSGFTAAGGASWAVRVTRGWP